MYFLDHRVLVELSSSGSCVVDVVDDVGEVEVLVEGKTGVDVVNLLNVVVQIHINNPHPITIPDSDQ